MTNPSNPNTQNTKIFILEHINKKSAEEITKFINPVQRRKHKHNN